MTSRSEASALRYGRGVSRDEVDEGWLLSGRRSDLMVGATGLGGGTPTFGVEPSRCCGWWTPGAGDGLGRPGAAPRGGRAATHDVAEPRARRIRPAAARC